jgi:hypothetical protein
MPGDLPSESAPTEVYETYIEPKIGWWDVAGGEEPTLMWQVSERFHSEEYKLAVQWTTFPNQVSSSGDFDSTLMYHEDDGTVVNWLLYDIDSSAQSTVSAVSESLSACEASGPDIGACSDRRAKRGVNSWNNSGGYARPFMGPCTYPLGYPAYGRTIYYKVELLIYKSREREFEEPVTYGAFHRAVPDEDIVGSCSFRPKAPVQSVGDTRNAADEGFMLLTEGIPVPEADGFLGSDDLRYGHNETVPCGAYGCRNCNYSPGVPCSDNVT